MAAGHELPQDYFAPFEGQNGSRDKEEAGCMTFGKFVSSFMYYCNNSSRFRQETAQRQRCIREVQQLLRGVIQAEVRRICTVQQNVARFKGISFALSLQHFEVKTG